MDDEDPGCGAFERGIEVLGKPSAASEPGEGALDHPAAGQEFKPFGGVGSLGDLKGPCSQRDHGVAQLVAGIAAIGEHVPQPRVQRAERGQDIVGFKDDQGEPMNEDASQFIVMAPIGMLATARAAVGSAFLANGVSNGLLAQGDWNVRAVGNARLTNTDRNYVFRTDGDVAAFIRQEGEGVTMSAIARGSELEFNDDVHHYGVKAIRNVGYGYWQKSCLTTFT